MYLARFLTGAYNLYHVAEWGNDEQLDRFGKKWPPNDDSRF